MPPSANLSIFSRLKNSGRTPDGSPSFISEWEASRYLGRGNFGVVYEIVKTNRTLGEQRSALKIIELDEKSIKKYKDELAALESVKNNPHGVSIEDYSELLLDEGDFVRRYLLIRMELLDKLPKDGMSEDDVIQMALDVSDVLSDCHSRQPRILHCDIKPENILMTRDGKYKLSDFGEARFLEESQGSSGMRGTLFYMSPEMHSCSGYDARSDLYSLGITMYTLLNGAVPFLDENTSPNEAIHKRLKGEKFPKIKGVRGDLQKMIFKLCDIDPNKRYQRASQLNRDLHALVKRKEEEAVRAEQAEIARKLKEKQKAEAARKREEQRAQREKERQIAAAEREKARLAQFEKQNEGIILGETLSAEQRERLSVEPVVSAPVAAAKNPAAKIPAMKIAAAVLCAVLLIGGGLGIASAVRNGGQVESGQAENEQSENGQSGNGQMDADRIAAEAPKKLVPLTEADRLLTEEYDFGWLGDGYEITNYKGSGGDVTIPDRYNGMEIKKIGNAAFSGRIFVSSVIIPDTVSAIGDYAFRQSGLKTIELSDSLTSIGSYAFYQCSSLESIIIPDSVTVIGDEAFSYCTTLSSISLSENLSRIGEYTFAGCQNLTSIAIPGSVTSISKNAFIGYLITVTAPHETSYYGYSPYDNVTWVVDKTLIGAADVGIEPLTDADRRLAEKYDFEWLGDGYEIVKHHSDETELVLPDSYNGKPVRKIGDSAFFSNYKIKSVTIPEGVETIGNTAFSQCSALSTISLPNGLTSIGDSSFSGCISLTKIAFPDSVTSIGDRAFHWCSNLTSITIPDGITHIGNEMFYGCYFLSNISIPDSVISIGNRAFVACHNLPPITIPDGMIGIGDKAFLSCTVTVTAPHEASYYGYTPDDGITWVVE